MRSKLCAVAVCAVLGAATSAVAQEDGSKPGTGSLGVGIAQTFFVSGLDVQFKLTDDITLEGLFGLSLVSPDMGDSVTNVNIGVRGLYRLADLGPKVDLAGFGGIGLGITNAMGQDTLIGIEAGLKLFWAIVPALVLHVDLGVAIGINETFGDDGMGTPLGGTSIDLGRGDLAGGAGLLYIFGAEDKS